MSSSVYRQFQRLLLLSTLLILGAVYYLQYVGGLKPCPLSPGGPDGPFSPEGPVGPFNPEEPLSPEMQIFLLDCPLLQNFARK